MRQGNEMNEGIAVILEGGAEGRPAPVSLELIAFAKSLRRNAAEPIRVFLPGRGIGAAAAELARLPGVAVTGIEGESLASYSAEAWKETLAPLLAARKTRFICVSHDANGADFAPGLAVRLGAACITAVEAFRIEAEGPVFSRSILKGKLQMEIVPEAETAVVTLLPGAFRRGDAPSSPMDKARKNETVLLPEEFRRKAIPPTGATTLKEEKSEVQGDRAGPPAAEMISVPDIPLKTRPLGLLPAPDEAADLAAAEVIVSAGRGIGGEENIELLRRLASLFSRAAIGASRAVCDAGWLPCRYQIGQTGKTVSPRLYIACGISGALQHLAGMRGSQCIVAVNRDPQAAIFRVADVAVVEELVSFLPLLIAACRKHREGAAEAGR
jgi:electron transfer flavoprotein alpha subunit